MKNRKKQPRCKKSLGRILLCLCLIFVFTATMFPPAVAAESTQASDMRLLSKEGELQVKNSSGKSVSIWEDMKLYSGYCLTTGANSCAYISLDSEKLVKMDADSQLEVRKSGEKLELLLSAGQLLFNVTAPLADSESMNIRTSTMVTGIRGTSGYVQVLPGGLSAVTVLDGQVEVVSVRSGEKESLSAGNSAYAEEGGGIRLAPVEQASIPGFVIRELQRDEALRQRVQEESGLPVEELLDSAEQRLEEERQEQREFRAQQNALLAEMPGQVSRPEGFVIPYIPEPVTSSSTAPPTASP